MIFEEELRVVLPPDIPNRAELIVVGARHLELVLEANKQMNLTRISNPREAAVKHVLDSVIPWRFFAGAELVLDVGTGAGFPGIPISVVLKDQTFLLCDSIGKKARFVEEAAEILSLSNVDVFWERGEKLASERKPQIITARAVAAIEKLIELFQKPLTLGAQLLLYRGPDGAAEIADVRKSRLFVAEVIDRYELPHDFGSRTIVRVTAQGRARKAS